MIKSNVADAGTIDIIDENIRKIALIESKRKSQNTNLKDKAASISEPIVNDVRNESERTQETIKVNSGLLNSLKRLVEEIKRFLSRSAEEVETQNGCASSGNSIKSMNNQLVEISTFSRDKNLESVEKSNDSVLNKVGYNKKQGIVAVENQDNTGKLSR